MCKCEGFLRQVGRRREGAPAHSENDSVGKDLLKSSEYGTVTDVPPGKGPQTQVRTGVIAATQTGPERRPREGAVAPAGTHIHTHLGSPSDTAQHLAEAHDALANTLCTLTPRRVHTPTPP